MSKRKSWKIQTKLFFLIVVTGFGCILLFRFLWLQKWNVGYFLTSSPSSEPPFFRQPENDIWARIESEAIKYNVPDSEDDLAGQEAIAPYLSLADKYTGLYIYGLEDGLYRAGRFPEILMQDGSYAAFFRMGIGWTSGAGERSIQQPVKFKNGYASVTVVFYHAYGFIVPWFLVCLFLCIAIFLLVVLFFVSRKLRIVLRLKEHVLQMSSGDLKTPVFDAGEDELGILARELDQLRCALRENILQEQAAHKSNQELITALSHDLRTPLTILNGYLEIIRRNQNQDMQAEYIGRCIQKTEDIKEMTDRMFAYALMYDDAALQKGQTQTEQLPASYVLDLLREHVDFLRLAGFQAELHQGDDLDRAGLCFGNRAMIKRVLLNLFSNMIKYADKKAAVVISSVFMDELRIRMKNKVKVGAEHQDDLARDPFQIGMKNVRKLMEGMRGAVLVETDGTEFLVELRFKAAEKPMAGA